MTIADFGALRANMLETAKWAFATRRVHRADAAGLGHDYAAAQPGDLVLARVESIGHHRRVQLPEGRPSQLHPGDLIVAACGARYAPDQFEGEARIDPRGADLLAGGGCIGEMTAKNDGARMPTRVAPLGMLRRADGGAMNLADYALPAMQSAGRIPVIAVFGAAMNSGKTTAAAALTFGLRRAGWLPAGLKGTGTGAFGDYCKAIDAGAHFVADFTDAGMVSTYRAPLSRIRAGIRALIAAAEDAGADIVVLEIADGLLQDETAALIADPAFRTMVSTTLFACADPISAVGGVGMLTAAGLRPEAVTGMVSCSPMASAEAMAATGVGIVSRADLMDPAEANRLAVIAATPALSAA